MIDLRPYQQHDINAILALLQRRRSPLYQLPTGGGKTVVFSQVTRVVVDLGWRVAIFVHRRELLDQASKALRRLGIEHGIVAPDHPMVTAQVYVASIDTVGARMGHLRDWLGTIDLAILDEAHHVVAGKWQRVIVAMSRALLLGPTATPWRTDGRPLGEAFSDALVGPSIRQLTADGHLTPSVVYAPPAAINLSGVKRRGGDYVQGELARAMDTDELARLAVRYYAQYAGGVPCVVFAAGVEHAHHLAAAFRAGGWAAAAVDGGMSTRERERAIAGLADDSLQILTSCDLISEGTDVPVVGACILLRPTQSTGLYLQQVGRILRPYEGKDEAVIIDLVGNVKAHGMPDEPRPWSLTGGLRGEERAVTATRRCRSCYRVHAWAETCPGCGRDYPARAAGGERAEQLNLRDMPGFGGYSAAQLAGMKHGDVVRLAQSEDDLRVIARIKGYKAGWVAHVAAEKGWRAQAFGGGRRW